MKDELEPGSYRTRHGGSWWGGARLARAACRRANDPSCRDDSLGLRLARRCP